MAQKCYIYSNQFQSGRLISICMKYYMNYSRNASTPFILIDLLYSVTVI